MAHTTLIILPAPMFIGDNDAQLQAGDLPAVSVNHIGRPAMAFDDTDEEAMVSSEFIMPGQYAAGTLTVDILFAMAADNANDIALDVYVEAVTPVAGPPNMAADASWDTLNAGTITVSDSTVGDLLLLRVTLTNKDSVAAGDLVRIGIRRDTDSGDDDATGDLYIYSVDLWETT